MADICITLDRKPRRAKLYYDATDTNSVRSYRNTPETICLQIRAKKEYTLAILTFAQARELAQNILAECPSYTRSLDSITWTTEYLESAPTEEVKP